MEFRVDATAKHDVYNLLIGLVAPRPVALVTSLNEDGGVNAAPYSAYNYLAIEPPVVALGIAERSGEGGAAWNVKAKDTARNIRQRGEFGHTVALLLAKKKLVSIKPVGTGPDRGY